MKVEEIEEAARRFSVNTLLKEYAYQNKPLDFETAYVLGCFALYPYKNRLKGAFGGLKLELAEKQSIAALCAFHNQEIYRQEGAEEQIAGIAAAVFDYDIGTSENGFLVADVEYAMDNCGMGGDLHRTPNVSTIAALIAAADGIPICKHGSPGNTDSTGSSDFLEFCGINRFAKKEKVEEALKEAKFGYVDALDTRYKCIHVQTHISAQLAHMNDIIGPITNPLHPQMMKRRVLGVNHLISPETVAKAYRILNKRHITNVDHGLFVRGFVDKDRNGGIDEVSVFQGGTKVAELMGDAVEVYKIGAEDFGIPVQRFFETPAGKDEKAMLGKMILEGAGSGAPKNFILANAAVLEYLARCRSFREGFIIAKDVLESQKPSKTIEHCIELTRD